jgi:hypothetical protein
LVDTISLTHVLILPYGSMHFLFMLLRACANRRVAYVSQRNEKGL